MGKVPNSKANKTPADKHTSNILGFYDKLAATRQANPQGATTTSRQPEGHPGAQLARQADQPAPITHTAAAGPSKAPTLQHKQLTRLQECDIPENVPFSQDMDMQVVWDDQPTVADPAIAGGQNNKVGSNAAAAAANDGNRQEAVKKRLMQVTKNASRREQFNTFKARLGMGPNVGKNNAAMATQLQQVYVAGGGGAQAATNMDTDDYLESLFVNKPPSGNNANGAGPSKPTTTTTSAGQRANTAANLKNTPVLKRQHSALKKFGAAAVRTPLSALKKALGGNAVSKLASNLKRTPGGRLSGTARKQQTNKAIINVLEDITKEVDILCQAKESQAIAAPELPPAQPQQQQQQQGVGFDVAVAAAVGHEPPQRRPQQQQQAAVPPQQQQQQQNQGRPVPPIHPPAPAVPQAAAAPLVGGPPPQQQQPQGGSEPAAAVNVWGSLDDDDDDFDLGITESAIKRLEAQHLGGAAAANPPPPAVAAVVNNNNGNNNNVIVAIDRQQQQQVAAAAHPAVVGVGVPASTKFVGDREEVHYKVINVYAEPTQVILELYNQYKNRVVFAYVQEQWITTFKQGDTVSLLTDKYDVYENRTCTLINDSQGMIILHPDLLLSGTRIAGGNECERKAFIDEFVGGDGGNAAAMKGTLFHELFQECVRPGGTRNGPQLKAKVPEIVAAHMEELIACDMDEFAAVKHLEDSVSTIIRWADRFIVPQPNASTRIAGPINVNESHQPRHIAVRQVHDIEESIWSTKFGIKGMVDASVELIVGPPPPPPNYIQNNHHNNNQHMQQQQAQQQQQQEQPIVTIAPFELKTGRSHSSHNAQVLLYLLMMEERYPGSTPDWGLLWYSSETDPKLVKRKRSDIVPLLATRNRLAAAIYTRQMPPVLTENKHNCERCFSKGACCIAARALHGAQVQDFAANTSRHGPPLNPKLAAIFDQASGHITQQDADFLKKFDRLLHLEESIGAARRPELWSMTSNDREAVGRCLAHLVMTGPMRSVGVGQCQYTFARSGGGPLPPLGLVEGEHLVLSLEGRHAAVARCYVVSIDAMYVTVEMRRPLRAALVVNGGKGSSGGAVGCNNGNSVVGFDGSLLWRLDKDEIASTFVRMRGNLYTFMWRDIDADGHETELSQVAAKLRSLIIQQSPPTIPTIQQSQTAATHLPTDLLSSMNAEQRAAVQRAIVSPDYTLVLGMPGSGKTTAIVAMVRALAAQGKTVMLTAYTNSAVDNILLRLASYNDVPFLRLGRPGSVHPDIVKYIPGQERYPVQGISQLKRLAADIKVFAGTCFSASHPLLKDRVLDVCIVDEAGQITVPAVLGPLMKSKSFVLVGDHNQLPPLVVNREANDGGLGVSLFAMLAAAHPEAQVALPVQYRMAADIQTLPNILFYDNQLRCGSTAQESATLQLSLSALTTPTTPMWLQHALHPQNRVAFLNTAVGSPASELRTGESVTNPLEVEIVLKIVRQAVAAGVNGKSIGVISPHRNQVSLLERAVKSAGVDGVECLTVDKCQGRDMDMVVLSLVRSNTERQAGNLLADWRRVNVAITRAKKKLLIVGDVGTVSSIELFEKLVCVCKGKGWVQDLPAKEELLK